jgi:hypothetical protein
LIRNSLSLMTRIFDTARPDGGSVSSAACIRDFNRWRTSTTLERWPRRSQAGFAPSAAAGVPQIGTILRTQPA